MNDQEKIQTLKNLNTKALIKNIKDYEDQLEKAMREDASFKNLNYEYLSSGINDCQAVKSILSELSAQIPDTNDAGKKITVDERKAWLEQQRTTNQELSGAISRQKDIAFLVDNNQISIEMAKKRLESAKAVLGLKTAQINFLAS